MQNRQKKVSTGRPYQIVSYIFVALFLSLIGYLVYFNVQLKDTYQTSPYNKRAKSNQEHVVRGELISSDGKTLAKTETAQDGKEHRVYPFERQFAHVIGYTGGGGGGLESSEEISLLTSHADPMEQVVNEFKDQKNIGDTVVTTLNSELQKAAYDALGDYNGSAIVMDVKTGDILADVSKPDFDPNKLDENWESLSTDNENSPLLNRSLQGLYPPGSTFKIVTALAYLEQNKTFDDFSFDCTGELTSGEYTIHCAGGAVHGHETFAEAFANSCNCAFAQIGLNLDKNKWDQMAGKLSFGIPLKLHLPSSKSKFSLDNQTDDPLVMQTSVGQGNTTMTPVHIALIADAVANGGTAMTPNFIKKVENHTGTQISSTKPNAYSRYMTEDQAEQLKDLMKGVVTHGTGRKLNDLGISIAGKTGSAEHGDMTSKTHSWFVGFSDTGDRDIVVCVMLESAGSGSSVAVPAARKIFKSHFGL